MAFNDKGFLNSLFGGSHTHTFASTQAVNAAAAQDLYAQYANNSYYNGYTNGVAGAGTIVLGGGGGGALGAYQWSAPPRPSTSSMGSTWISNNTSNTWP